MLLGCIADDFTGASDLANTLAKGRMRVLQLIGVPGGTVADCDAAVVALKSRSIPPPDAVTQSRAALAWLEEQGCRQFLFKYCSTFDSTPEGNIGPVAEALAQDLGAKAVIVCPAFPTAGRTVYQGHLFVFDRLLSESGMERHPLTPMTDPDLRRWLRQQTQEPVGHLPLATVRQGPEAIAAALEQAAQEGTTFIVADAVFDEDLVALGRAAAGARLITGGSGIALGLPANFRQEGLLAEDPPGYAGRPGPGAVLAGSCSGATLRQIVEHARTHPALAVDPDQAMAGEIDPGELARFALEHAEGEPLLFTSAEPARVAEAQARHGREALSERLESLFADTARRLVDQGVARLVVAGGETSGAVVSALGIRAVSIGPEIDPGVPALLVETGPPLALALKSGNFGGPDFFSRALRVLGGEL
jgi:3-dehydrotetronate 4-kinase